MFSQAGSSAGSVIVYRGVKLWGVSRGQADCFRYRGLVCRGMNPKGRVRRAWSVMFRGVVGRSV